jgi:integrase
MPKRKGVYRKGNKWYAAKWYKGKTYTGPLRPTAEAAAADYDRLVRDLAAGAVPSRVPTERFFREYLEHLAGQVDSGIRTDTFDVYEKIARTVLLPRLPATLKGLTARALDEAQNAIRRDYSDSYARQALSFLRRALDTAVRWELLPRNELHIQRRKTEKVKPAVLTMEQYRTLLDRAAPRERALIGLGGMAGLRRSEAFGLRVEDIDFKGGCIHVHRQVHNSRVKEYLKSQPARVVPLLPELERILRGYIQHTGWLFPGKTARVLNASGWIRDHFQPLLAACGLPHVRYHSLRHFFDVTMHNLGYSTRDIMQMMGHQTVKMSMHYDRESPEHLVRITRDARFFSDVSLEYPLESGG